MKTILYYFSGTGNTLMLARSLAERLGNTEIINIAGCHDLITAPQADTVGILFPVYAFGLPKMVREFVKNHLQVNDDTYLFALTNYASSGGPATLKQLKAVFRAKGNKLQAGFGLGMPANYIPFGGAESQEKQTERFIAAASELKTIARIIKERPENYFYKKSHIPSFITAFISRLFSGRCNKEAKKFYSNDNCTSCGLCTEICPTQNVTLVEGRPVWGGNCEQCMACLQWCPVDAIHRKGVSESREHYRNPTVDAQDLIKDMHRQT